MVMRRDNKNTYQAQVKENDHQERSKDEHLRKMFLGGLSINSTEDSVRSFYCQFGEVLDVVIMRDPVTKRSRGFGFITYSDPSMVDAAQSARPHVIDGKAVDSKRALPRPEGKESSSSVKKIFVGGLKEYHDEQALQEHFEQFGKIISIKILTDKNTGRKRGFAFIEFDDYDSVDKAVLHQNHTIKYVMVDVKKSSYKQEIAKKYAAQQQNGMQQNPGMQSVQPDPYQQQAAAYPQAPYGYAPAPAYNGWGGYAQAPPPTYPQQPAYGAYPAPAQNGYSAYPQAPAAWPQNGYAAAPPATVAPAAPAANGWTAPAPGAAAAPAAGQNFGNYQQTYNGGPQKGGNLQGNRMNPYNVSAAPTYGN